MCARGTVVQLNGGGYLGSRNILRLCVSVHKLSYAISACMSTHINIKMRPATTTTKCFTFYKILLYFGDEVQQKKPRCDAMRCAMILQKAASRFFPDDKFIEDFTVKIACGTHLCIHTDIRPQTLHT